MQETRRIMYKEQTFQKTKTWTGPQTFKPENCQNVKVFGAFAVLLYLRFKYVNIIKRNIEIMLVL
jgi:hypothetical protein